VDSNSKRIPKALTVYLPKGLVPKTDEEIFVMATVENVSLVITASTTKPGYSEIEYSYELHPSELDCAWQREYTISTVLCGEDVIEDDVLAWGKDEHKVKFDDSGPCEFIKVGRIFEIETKVLDEDLFGDDEVYLIVEARSGLGPDAAGENLVISKSNTVIGDF
jgi:hypothetical protein